MREVHLGIRGGGVKSITSIGVLLALEENGIKVSEISGTSIGSVVAALYAAGHNPIDIYWMFKENLYNSYVKETRVKGGKGNFVIKATVDNICDGMVIGKTKIPVTISANCGGILNPKLFLFDRESTPNVSLGIACQASSSFPFLYKRYKTKINGNKEKFFDGGMIANPPILKKKEDDFFVLATFQTEKVNTKSLYVDAWRKPEEIADIVIKPFVGNMRSVGTAEDMKRAFYLGYEAALKALK